LKITVAGTGYVGFSLAVLLAQRHDVTALDIVQSRVDLINSGKTPIVEENISKLLESGNLRLKATTDKKLAYKSAELVIIATPTNYDASTNFFDTSSIDDVVENVLKYNKNVPMFVKSTVPIGFTVSMRVKYDIDNIYFSPEFLREGKSLYDNLYPSRIIVGDMTDTGKMFGELLREAALNDPKVVYMNPTEAEAVKLFANTYMAMRVAYFNELDSYANVLGLDTMSIINGVCLEPRIGEGYNNPSFGYGGYCFPKDAKQLVANFRTANLNESLMTGVVQSNELRKQYIANDIDKKYPTGKIGIYKTAMKATSDNNRSSSIIAVGNLLKAMGREVVCYDEFNKVDFETVNSVDELGKQCSVIITNRLDDNKLNDYLDKVYTRDIFHNN